MTTSRIYQGSRTNHIFQIILLNILIALYNSAYEDIYGNADDEYLALLAQKTMQFVRAPDENVYIPPLNLIEIVLVILCEWWMPKKTYEAMNDVVMGVIYSPLLLCAAFFETRRAGEIRSNRARGEEDDDVEEEWEQMASQVHYESESWAKICDDAKPNVEEEPAIVEVKRLRQEIDELRSMLAVITKAVGADSGPSTTQNGKEHEDKKDDARASSSGTE